MKRNGDIASFFRKYEAKAKKTAISIDIVDEAQFDEQEPTLVETTKNQEQEPPPVYDVDRLQYDPGLRVPIASFDDNEQDAVRRAYILKGPNQSYTHDFPIKEIYGKKRHFSFLWFHKYNWLEYSVAKDAGFCMVCYLFGSGSSNFVKDGWRNWNKSDAFDKHVGGITSAHNKAQEKYNLFVKGGTSTDNVIVKVSKESEMRYNSMLTYSLRCVRFLLNQGLALSGHDESEESSGRGNFIELLKLLAKNNEEVDHLVLKNTPENCSLTCSSIQRQIIDCCARETTRHIIEDIGGDYFAILANECSDLSQKEQVALCLRYVDKFGRVCERFLGVVYVASTTTTSLKRLIQTLLTDHHLSPSQIRGQGYVGASNMKGKINGLKRLIMKESSSAYYIHCFAYQLQLVLVCIAKENHDCGWFFIQVSLLLNIIGSSCKSHGMLRDVRAQKLMEALELGEIESEIGLNQEMELPRLGDIRWSSYFKTILHIIDIYTTIQEVLITLGKDPTQRDDWPKIHAVVGAFESFDFVFSAHLMVIILGYTNELSISLQKRDQDIVNAMSLVTLTKERIQKLRNHGWEDFYEGTVISFCTKHKIEVPTLNAKYVPHGRSARFYPDQTNNDHFRREVYNDVIDKISQELDNMFDEVNMELLICMASLNPSNSFASYDAKKILKLAKFYPKDISSMDLIRLEYQLDTFIDDMRQDERFRGLQNLSALSVKLVEANKHVIYDLVYLLLKLVLILPVATASVERVFSALCLVENTLRNNTCDKLLNDCLVTFIERDVFSKVSEDDIIKTFMGMKTRRLEKN